ncbi:MAG TPA: hypothetical protein VNE16_16825 [Vicinamibacterales bacterium]|nr:hypothetical protein [Vicinamibacterales bacterium]
MTAARTFQVLGCEVSIATACPEIAGRLDYVVVSAVQQYPVSRRVAYQVDREDDGYLVRENGNVWYRDGSADRVLIELFRRMHAIVYGQMHGRLRLHAGCGSYQGKLFLTAGPKGVGKSTLMARLVFEGFSVSGDEMVFGLGREVIALPRRFHLKAPALDLLPQVAAVADRLPFVMGEGGQKIVAFDPTDAGLPWAIGPGGPVAIFFLQPNHGGTTTVQACPKLAMIQRLMSQSLFDGREAGAWIQALGTLVRAADCYTLHMGDLSMAARLMQTTLNATVAPRWSAEPDGKEDPWQKMRVN